MKQLRLSLAVIFICSQSFAQTDPAGSGRAIVFDGVDDYIDLGNIYDDLSLPITISVWVKVSEVTGYAFPVFNSQDNLPLYNGVTFLVQPENISIQYGDGRGENLSNYRRGKAAIISDISGRWVNVSAVMRAGSDMDLFVNGINVGGFYDGSSSFPMSSDSPDDHAKIGYWLSNSITSRFRGTMDELRIFNKSLSATEIREQMCKRLLGNEPGLIGYWTFDEINGNILEDQSTNHFDGTVFGNPTRVFSGAPVGDESVFVYPDNWSDRSLSMDNLSVSDVAGSAQGVHIYRVDHVPSQSGGLDATALQLPYYGVFLAGESQDGFFDISFENLACTYFERKDNTGPVWAASEVFSGIHERIEIVTSSAKKETDLNVNLGSDVVLCDENSFLLEADPEPVGKTFEWNNGQTSAAVTVTLSGQYSVEVTRDCLIDKDTVEISFLKSPPEFSFGEDEWLCTMEPRTLTAGLETQDFEFMWQDGSDQESFVAADFGAYSLTVQNECGSSADEIVFLQKDQQDLSVSLGEDMTFCEEVPYTLLAHAEPDGKTFEWNTGETTQAISIKSTGTYSVIVRTDCKTARDTVHITFLTAPPSFSLGEDEILCTLPKDRRLSIAVAEGQFDLTWQNGSKGPTLLVDDFGTYWLKLENMCGSFADSITFTRRVLDDLELYNFISPGNADDLNEYFVLDEKISGGQLRIFNRWGKPVYESFNYQNNWNGAGLPAGVYFYTVSGECLEARKGTVTIMR